MKPNDKAYKEFMRVYNKTHVSLEAQIMASLTAAFAAQFQSEDYAVFVEGLRHSAILGRRFVMEPNRWVAQYEKAADVIDALLAERDALKAERDALLARLVSVVAPVGDGITDDLAAIQQYRALIRAVPEAADIFDALLAKRKAARLSPVEANADPLTDGMTVTMPDGEETRLVVAPVDDDALVEIAVRTIHKEAEKGPVFGGNLIPAVIAAIRPHIEAAERERCAKIASGLCESCGGEGWLWAHELGIGLRNDDTKYSCDGQGESIACKIAEAIRSGK